MCRITVAAISVKRQISAHVSHYCRSYFSQTPKFGACVALLSLPFHKRQTTCVALLSQLFQSSAKFQRICRITVAVISVKRKVQRMCCITVAATSQAPKFSACVALLSQPRHKRQSSARVSHYCRSYFSQAPNFSAYVALLSQSFQSIAKARLVCKSSIKPLMNNQRTVGRI